MSFVYSLFLLIMPWALECLTVIIAANQTCFTNRNNQEQSSVFSYKGKGFLTTTTKKKLFLLALTCQALFCPHYCPPPIHIEGERSWWPRVTAGTRIHTIRAWVCVYLVFTAQLPLSLSDSSVGLSTAWDLPSGNCGLQSESVPSQKYRRPCSFTPFSPWMRLCCKDHTCTRYEVLCTVQWEIWWCPWHNCWKVKTTLNTWERERRQVL